MNGTTHHTNGSGKGADVPPWIDAREGLACLVEIAADLDALLEVKGNRLPPALLGQLRLDLARAVDRLAWSWRRLRATAPRG